MKAYPTSWDRRSTIRLLPGPAQGQQLTDRSWRPVTDGRRGPAGAQTMRERGQPLPGSSILQVTLEGFIPPPKHTSPRGGRQDPLPVQPPPRRVGQSRRDAARVGRAMSSGDALLRASPRRHADDAVTSSAEATTEHSPDRTSGSVRDNVAGERVAVADEIVTRAENAAAVVQVNARWRARFYLPRSLLAGLWKLVPPATAPSAAESAFKDNLFTCRVLCFRGRKWQSYQLHLSRQQLLLEPNECKVAGKKWQAEQKWVRDTQRSEERIQIGDIVTARAAQDQQEAHGSAALDSTIVLTVKSLGDDGVSVPNSLVLQTVPSEGGSPSDERRTIIAFLTESRKEELFHQSRIGISFECLQYLTESSQLMAVRAKLRSLTVADIEHMIVQGPLRNGTESEKGSGSWSTQIQLPCGRVTWANTDCSEVAPTSRQLHRWLQGYIETTRCVWENVIDPVLFADSKTYEKLSDETCGSTVEHIQKRNDGRAILKGLIGEANMFVSQVG